MSDPDYLLFSPGSTYWFDGLEVVQNNLRSAIKFDNSDGFASSGIYNYFTLVPSGSTASVLAVRGPITAPENPAIPVLTSGWNLIGLKGTATISADSLGAVISVWKWVDINGAKAWAVYIPGDDDKGAAYATSKGFGQLATINPGEGFWVNKP